MLHFVVESALNQLDNVLPFNMALSDRNGVFRMAPFGKELGDSTTSLLDAGSTKNSIGVSAITLKTAQEIALPMHIDFLKIDIEGAEFSFIPSIKDYLSEIKPIVYLSTHSPYLAPENRRESMCRLLDTLAIYDIRLDENLSPVSRDDLLNEKAVNDFKSLLFLDATQHQAAIE
ncbi:MAG: FkbM family methyltransferase [Pseudomonadota bacterium]